MITAKKAKHECLLGMQFKFLAELSQKSPKAFLRCLEDIRLFSEGRGNEAVRDYYYSGLDIEDFKRLLEAAKELQNKPH